jgi:phosphoribosylanthranilate isomerase
VWVKICANTTLDDALMATDLGADAVGFIFAPSPRQVSIAQVAAITHRLPPQVERVGVFAGSAPEDIEKIADAADQAGLTVIQLHGAVDLSFADALQQRLGPSCSILQTAHWHLDHNDASEAHVATLLRELAAHPSPYRILIDAKVGSASGGLGVSFDWSRAKSVLASQPRLKVIVAGGLTPRIVAEAIAQLQPYGVDVASGVEQSPGKKDPGKLKRFIQAARGAV